METEESNWVLLDFDVVVVHLFLPEAREYYGLETLWADVPRVPFTPAPAAPVVAAGNPPTRPGWVWRLQPEEQDAGDTDLDEPKS